MHAEICALLIEVLESLKTNLTDFSCVLSSQWVGLISVTTSNINPSERLEQLTNSTKVYHNFFIGYSDRQFFNSNWDCQINSYYVNTFENSKKIAKNEVGSN